MNFVITRAVWDIETLSLLTCDGYYYEGPVEKCCGASDQQQQIEASQQAYYTTLTQEAQAEFGMASNVFNDIYGAMSPIVAAGPDQQGFSPAELTNLNTVATDSTGQAYSAAAQSARQQEAAAGGSNFVPSGATEQINAEIAGQGASQLANTENNIEAQNYAIGRQNFYTATADLAGATGTFNPATGAAGAANAGGAAAANTANQIAEENNSWVNAVTGALGGIAGQVAKGGMQNLGQGVGFFGQNAPAPGSSG